MKRTSNPAGIWHGEGATGPRQSRRIAQLCAAVALVIALAACGDEDTGRRFANETPPTIEPSSFTPTVQATTVTSTQVAGPPILSPEAMIVSRGAPGFFYVPNGEELLVFSADGGSQNPVWKGKKGELRDIASSPSGDRVALLTESKGRYDVTVIDNQGKKVQTFERVRKPFGAGTPEPVSLAGRDLIDWSPQGNQLLAAFANGGIVSLPLNGEPVALLSPQQAPGPLAAAWSPAGDAIAYVNRNDPDAPSRLYRLDLASGSEPEELYPKTADESRSVANLKWLPDASAILFTRTNPDDNLPQGGDLFEIPSRGGDATIVVSSRRAAPVAAIDQVVASPNGRAIAFTVDVPGTERPEFHSLWLQQLETNNAVRISTPPEERVTDVWFVADGLAYRTVPGEPKDGDVNSVAVYVVGPDGEPKQVMATGELVPATPVASPIGSPSPGATPTG